MNVLTCPACKSVTASKEKCSVCGLVMLSCPACGGLNPASGKVCFVCGQGFADNTPLDAAAINSLPTAMNSPARVNTTDSSNRIFVFADWLKNVDRRFVAKLKTIGNVPQLRPAAEPRPSAVSKASSALRARKRMVVGVARGCQARQDTNSQILTFRLDRFDDAGRPLPSLQVEMRGMSLKGYVNDGELIEVPGEWPPGSLLEPQRVRNLTTNSWVEVRGMSPGQQIVMVLMVLVVLVFLAFFAAIIATQGRLGQ
jgi:hypothetical protein